MLEEKYHGIVCEEKISITRGLGKKILTQTD